MANSIKTYMNWSGGKDCCLALDTLINDPHYQVDSLFTVLNDTYKRISMHGVAEHWLDKQAKAIGIPLNKAYMPENADMLVYEQLMQENVKIYQEAAFKATAFGDIFLEDLKKYREDKLADSGFEILFPLWKQATQSVLTNFLNKGYRAIIVSINGSLLDKSFAGKELSHELVASMPEGIDCCGENGEFHTFVFDGPIFNHPVAVKAGEVVEKKYTTEHGEYCYFFAELVADF